MGKGPLTFIKETHDIKAAEFIEGTSFSTSKTIYAGSPTGYSTKITSTEFIETDDNQIKISNSKVYCHEIIEY